MDNSSGMVGYEAYLRERYEARSDRAWGVWTFVKKFEDGWFCPRILGSRCSIHHGYGQARNAASRWRSDYLKDCLVDWSTHACFGGGDTDCLFE